MIDLSNLKNTSRPKKKVQRIGRGVGSKRGVTSGRGQKGDGARQGYRRRYGYEGGQVPLYRKLPVRGFTRGTFVQPSMAITFSLIEAHFQDGELVSLATLREKGIAPRRLPGGIKILATGKLTKKVNIEADAFSEAAKKILEENNISFKVVE